MGSIKKQRKIEDEKWEQVQLDREKEWNLNRGQILECAESDGQFGRMSKKEYSIKELYKHHVLTESVGTRYPVRRCFDYWQVGVMLGRIKPVRSIKKIGSEIEEEWEDADIWS